MKIILPEKFCNVNPNNGPVLFLEGPIEGGNYWQYKAIREIKKYLEKCYVVLPITYKKVHPPLPKQLSKENKEDDQVIWKRYFVQYAAENGCLIIWLPKEIKTKSLSSTVPYSCEAQRVIGEWLGRLRFTHYQIKLVIGAEKGFPGLDGIKKDFKYGLKEDYPFYDTLEDTIKAAIEEVQKRKK